MKSEEQRFLTSSDIETAINEMKSVSEDMFVIVGGVAMMFYGSDRHATGVDFIVYGSSDIPSYILEQKTLVFGGVSGITPRGVPVNFIARSDDFYELYIDATNDSRRSKDGYDIATPEHLAIMKMVAGRSKDMSDLNFLVTSNDFDLSKAQKLVRTFLGAYGLKEFNSLVQEAKWRAEKDKG